MTLTETITKVLLVILAGLSLLVWQQPRALYSLAAVIEHASGKLVRWLRIRAAAKADSTDTYRRALAWHRDMMER